MRVSAQWLAAVRAYWDSSGKTLRHLGVELAEILGEPRPLVPRHVHDYIQGTSTTEELTAAFAQLMDVPPPILGIEDDEIVRWCEIGQRLKAQTPDRFREELDALSALVDTLESFRRRR